jgi:hypothetical protein
MLALLPLLASLAPGLIRWIAGDEAGAVASQVVGVVQAATGTSTPEAAIAAAGNLPPDERAKLAVQLAQIQAQAEQAARQSDLDELKAHLGDVGGARRQTVSLASAGSPIAWGAPVISVLVLAAFGTATFVVLTKALPAGSQEVALYTMGALQAMACSVVTYWVGSSAGSAAKSSVMEATARAAAAPLGVRR